MGMPTVELLVVGFIVASSVLVLLYPLPLTVFMIAAVSFALFDISNLMTLKLAGWLLWLLLPPVTLMDMMLDTCIGIDDLRLPHTHEQRFPIADININGNIDGNIDGYGYGYGYEMIGMTVYLRDLLMLTVAIIATTAGIDNKPMRIICYCIYLLCIMAVSGGRGYTALEVGRVVVYLITYRLVYVMATFRHDIQPCTIAWLASGWTLFSCLPAVALAAIPLAITYGRHHLILQRRRGMESGDLCAAAEPVETRQREHAGVHCQCLSTSSSDSDEPEQGRSSLFNSKERNLMALALANPISSGSTESNSMTAGLISSTMESKGNNNHNNHSQFIVINQVTRPTINSLTVTTDATTTATTTTTQPQQSNNSSSSSSGRFMLSADFEDRVVAMLKSGANRQQPSIGLVRSSTN
jgi:hypothetical protein